MIARYEVVPCPCCGKPLEDMRARVDLTSKTLFTDGKAIKLRLSEAKIMAALLDARGRIVTLDRLDEAIHDGDLLIDSYGSIRHHIKRIRPCLEGTSLQIRAEYSIGYRLVEEIA